MKTNKKLGFTLIEIVVSISILMVIVAIVSLSVLNVNKSIYMAGKEVAIFEDLNTLLIDKYKTNNYDSGAIISYSTGQNALLLFQTGGPGILYGIFDSNIAGYDFMLSQKYLVYEKQNLGSFALTSTQVVNILSNHGVGKTIKFNNGEIFKNIFVNSLKISPLQGGKIFQMDLNIFLDLPENILGKGKTEYFLEKENFIDVNIIF